MVENNKMLQLSAKTIYLNEAIGIIYFMSRKMRIEIGKLH